MTALERVLGYAFTKGALLQEALTHPSCASGEDYQRLEFLGDAVLELIVSERLYRVKPSHAEGALTVQRAQLVREESLSVIAEKISLGDFLRMDAGEAASGGASKPSVLSDALEAVLGAVYLDGGLSAAHAVVETLFTGFTPPSTIINHKSRLQEVVQVDGSGPPEYRDAGFEGPPHERQFRSEVWVHGVCAGVGQGNTKKQAEQAAAERALQQRD